MEREIKFRGKAFVNDLWVRGSFFCKVKEAGEDSRKMYIISEIDFGRVEYRVDLDTIGQFTGLKDQNGTEIYEGDILWWRCEDEPEIEIRGMVYYEDAAFRVKLEVWRNGEPLYSYGSRYLADVYENDGLRVIGNVFDNPKLFETKDGYYGKINQNK